MSALALAAVVASGSLECSYPVLTPAERRGSELYGRMCAVCHGPAGEGYKADQAPAVGHPEFLSSASDVFLHAAVANGRTDTTMSAWSVHRGGPLVREDIENIISFFRSWERPPRPKLDERALKGSAPRGTGIYAKNCARCHGARGVGGPNVSIGDRELLATATNGFLRHAIRKGRPGTAMQAYEDVLSAQDIDDVIALIRSFQAPQPHLPQAPRVRPPPIPLGPVPLNPKGPEPVGFESHPSKTGADIVKRELDRRARMAILDARPPSDYALGHIAGAVSVPFYDPDHYFPALPKDAWLVCYCSCPAAESGMLAQALVAKGFKKVTVLAEGLGYWRAKKYGTTTGDKP